MTGAFSYLFNYLAHVHRALSMRGAVRADLGLTYDEAERFGKVVVDVDIGTQAPEQAYMHSMCTAAASSAECGRAIARYTDRLWEDKSVDSLAKLIHLEQDAYAPRHAGGQSYGGFGLANMGEAISHAWSDRMPEGAAYDQLVNRTRTLIRNYNDNCAGCVKSGLRRGR
jgi:hypothetical protein